jgi:hypothetical protein
MLQMQKGEQPDLANEVEQERYLCFDVMARVFISRKSNIWSMGKLLLSFKLWFVGHFY